MGQDFNTVALSRYDREKAFQAYKAWVEQGTDSSLEAALIAAAPMIGQAIRNFSKASFADTDEMVSEAGFLLYRLMRDRGFDLSRYEGDACPCRPYAKYLHRALLRKLISSYPRGGSQLLTGGTPTYGYVVRARDAEFKVFLEELPSHLSTVAAERVRFEGNERDAVLHVIGRLVSGRLVALKQITRRYGVKNPRFYVDYATVLLRSLIYEMRHEFGGVVIGDWTEIASEYNQSVITDDFEDDEPTMEFWNAASA